MSNLNIKQSGILMPTFDNYYIIYSNKNKTATKEVIMTYISELEENLIDDLDKNILKLNRGDRTFTIRKNNIYCHGEIDLTNKDELKHYENLNFLSSLQGSGVPIPSGYDYDTHSCISDLKFYKITETVNPLDLIKYAHGSLKKPQRIIIFNQG